MTNEELIKHVMGALCNHYDMMAVSRDCFREDAQVAVAAIREALEPVGWMYAPSHNIQGYVAAERYPLSEKLIRAGWTETPLFAWPEESK